MTRSQKFYESAAVLHRILDLLSTAKANLPKKDDKYRQGLLSLIHTIRLSVETTIDTAKLAGDIARKGK